MAVEYSTRRDFVRRAALTTANKTRSLVEWDGAAERFINNEAANRLLPYQYRLPYKVAGVTR